MRGLTLLGERLASRTTRQTAEIQIRPVPPSRVTALTTPETLHVAQRADESERELAPSSGRRLWTSSQMRRAALTLGLQTGSRWSAA
jgi:hypothetical protein